MIYPQALVAPEAMIGDATTVHPFAFIGKEPLGRTSRPIAFARSIRIGARCQIGPHATIYFDVEIGDDCLIGDGASIREGARIGPDCVISRHVSLNFNVTVGEGSRIMDGSHLTGDMIVGKRCFLAPGVMTANDNAIGRSGYDAARVHGPVIEDDVAIGAGAILLPGIRIGAGATIAAGAVVTRDIARGEFVLGIPARAAHRRPDPSEPFRKS